MIIIFIVFLRVLPAFQLVVNLANCGLGYYSHIHPEKCFFYNNSVDCTHDNFEPLSYLARPQRCINYYKWLSGQTKHF